MTLKEFFTGVENPTNRYEQNPFLSWLLIIGFLAYAIWASTIVFSI